MPGKTFINSIILLMLLAGQAFAESKSGESVSVAVQKAEQSNQEALAAVRKISSEIQQLKQGVISLNKDLRLMEESVMFPSSTQFTVFVTLDIGKYFSLEGLKLKIDGKMVTSHIYSEKQRNALARGGVQKLYMTNLNEGKHTVTAFFAGVGPNGRAYKRATNIELEKGKSSQYIDLAVIDDQSRKEPIFKIRQW